jgi:hypothetical protein
MELFHVIVLTVALVILILLLTFIGILMAKQKTSLTYPPAYNTCPDYWSVATDGSSCVIPNYGGINTGKLYTGMVLDPSVFSTPGFTAATSTTPNQINFKASGWNGTVCSQKTWTANYNVVWDGVSNYNSC